MKFISPLQGSTLDLAADVLALGDNLKLIHSSQWPKEHAVSGQSGCWSQELEPLQVLQILLSKQTSSVLQSLPDDFGDDVKAWVDLREKPLSYFGSPLECLMPSGSCFESHQIMGSQEKEKIRSRVLTFANENGNVACAEAFHAIFEEQFMNAMMDAPREAQGKAVTEPVTFYLGMDQRRLGIACLDPYGSLKIDKLLYRMLEVYEKGAGTAINLRGPGGAGIGCTIMLERSALICFGVLPGRATLVSCLVHRHFSHRRRAELKKSFHLVTNE